MSKFSKMFGGDSSDAWQYSEGHAKRARRMKIASAATGVLVVGAAVVFAATNWTIGLTGGTGSAQSQSVSNLTVTASTSGSFSNQLFPGGNGDVSITITNPNAAPVTVTGFSLPANTTYAAGYSDQALTTAQSGCTSSTSLVAWNYATGTSGSAHTLTTPVTVAANGTLVVTLTNDASMALTTPAACESTYFKMPAMTAVAATAGAAVATTSPATDAWTS
jgi:hypothetical protein